MSARKNCDTLLGKQGLMIQIGEIVERRVQQCDISPSRPQVVSPVGRASEEDIHLTRIGLTGILGKDSR